jgi:pyruvate,orthophosphate dikinase
VLRFPAVHQHGRAVPSFIQCLFDPPEEFKMAKARRYVYFFGQGKAEGTGAQKELLGGKGAGLAEMTRIGLPVPAGFTITTECCAEYYARDRRWPPGLESQVRAYLRRLEKVCGRRLGARRDPLLVSVRSGAARSMPGMMETILNLGLNDESVEGLAASSGNRRFALDAYRRFIMMFGSTARGIERRRFEEAFDHLKDHYSRPRLNRPEHEPVLDTEVNEEEIQSLIGTFKDLYRRETGEEFPQKPHDQLVGAIDAVFSSWMAEKAVTYRRVERISDAGGTAVNVVQMVFGNMGEDSGTGVCFTRDPSTGENVFYGDLLINAQGEDVVAGLRTPRKLSDLKKLMPQAYEQLEAVRAMLEIHYQDMMDLEFTIERGKLYMLQCRAGKRSPRAVFKIAVEQATRPLMSRAEAGRLVRARRLPADYARRANKPVITQDQAIRRIAAADVERLFHHVIDPDYPQDKLKQVFLGRGINAVPGAASGQIALNSARSEEMAERGIKTILVRKETSPEDVGGMHVAEGILTATGGKTSHAAVVARGWGKCCVVGCDALRIDEARRTLRIGSTVLSEGESITLDGSSGAIYRGSLPLVMPEMPREFNTLMSWCDRRRKLGVRGNADTPQDARQALELGAEGIGLCRTEHMFFDSEERRLAIQEMILADSSEARRAALQKLKPFQREDFVGIFQAMDGKAVTIRLIDPPLHEFLPKTDDDVYKLRAATGASEEDIAARTQQLHESNPMLGHRGCRLSVTYPEILEMQTESIMEAAVIARGRGAQVFPEIMIPLTIDGRELAGLVDQVRCVADRVLAQTSHKIRYTVGTMIETPRAALLGDRIAASAEFFSFGTNDLTQTTMALSRDDAGRFLPAYVGPAGIFKDDPFQTLDVDGVGMLMRWAIERGREVRPQLKVGICGEHGGDPESVRFCHALAMDYVSCSPFRVPVARLAAAQAAIAEASSPAARSAPPRRAAAKVRPVSRRRRKLQPTVKKSKKRARARRGRAS